MATRASGRSQSKLKCETHPSVAPTFTWERGSFSQEGSVELLNDKPTAIIRKASSIHNFEFNLIRHPANFITYLTGLLIQFTLLLFQRTAPGPVVVGNAREDTFGNAVAPSHNWECCSPKPTLPWHSAFLLDKGIDHVLGFIFLPPCKEV